MSARETSIPICARRDSTQRMTADQPVFANQALPRDPACASRVTVLRGSIFRSYAVLDPSIWAVPLIVR